MPSLWDVIRKLTNPLGLPKWPNPLNWIIDWEVLACKDTWYAKIGFRFAVFADFFWTTFIPNPNEIFRKSAMGTYRCGFYRAPGFKGIIEVVAGRGTQTQIVKVARPLLTATWYWWAGSSAWSAANAIDDMLHRERECQKESAEVILEHGDVTVGIGTSEGAFTLWEEEFDPDHLHVDNSAFINYGPGANKVWAWGKFRSSSGGWTNVQLRILDGASIVEVENIGTIPAGQEREWQIEYKWEAEGNGLIGVGYQCTLAAPDVTRVIEAHKFIADVHLPI